MKNLPLWKKGQIIAHAIVDDDLFDILSEVRWYTNSKGYPCRWQRVEGKNRYIPLHLAVFGEIEPGFQVDHIDRNKLNALRSNLRSASTMQNNRNRTLPKGSSSHRGIAFDKSRSKWQVQPRLNGKKYYLGRFASEVEAVKVLLEWREKNGVISWCR